MKYNCKGIKALEFENAIDNTFFNLKCNECNLIHELLEKCNIYYDREDIMDYGRNKLSNIIEKHGLIKIIDEFNTYVPSDLEKFNEDFTCVHCTNKSCECYQDDKHQSCYNYYDDCWADAIIYIDLAVMIGGNHAKKEISEKWKLKKEWINLINSNEKGWFEKELYEENLSIEEAILRFKKMVYGDEDMFLQKFTKLNNDDDISVFWIDDVMYVNDESDGQAEITIDLFGAYKFATLINAPIFDYEASDDDVRYLHDELLKLVDYNWCKINVWKYFDDISNDFEKLTGIKLDSDDKRHVVSLMCENNGEGYDLFKGFGSATFIARKLWDYIKGNEKFGIPKCDNKVINQLADEYLQTDYYDLEIFAEELHEKVNTVKTIGIDGMLWVNGCKYEYVDKITVDDEEVNIYQNDKIIGCVSKESISIIQEQSEQGIFRDLMGEMDINPTYLKAEAIEEISNILGEVINIQNVVERYGVYYSSDCWLSTDSDTEDYEDILSWESKDFMKVNINDVTEFYIGGSVCSGRHVYKNKYITEPKELAEAKGKFVEKYLKEIINNTNLKYFDLELYDYGLEESEGWEHGIGIKAKIKNILKN